MNIYGFTIRKTGTIKNMDQFETMMKTYNYLITKMKQDHPTGHIEYHFEIVHKNTGLNVHIHGMCKLRLGALYVKAPRGYSCKIEKTMRTTWVWKAYITKASYTEEELYKAIKVWLEAKTIPQDARRNSRNEVRKYSEASEESEEYIEDEFDNIIIPKRKLFS